MKTNDELNKEEYKKIKTELQMTYTGSGFNCLEDL